MMNPTNNNDHDAYDAFVDAIATAMADGWHRVIVPRDSNMFMSHHREISNGTTTLVFLRQYSNPKGKIAVSADFTSGAAYLPDRPSINVSESRSASAIAADIKRRLLPNAIDYAERCRAALETANDHAAALAANVATLAAALGDSPTDRHGEINTRLRAYTSNAGGWGDFTANHRGESWTLDLHSVPTATAIKIAALLREGPENA